MNHELIESRLRVVRHIPRVLGALLALGMMTLAGCSDRSSSGSPAAASVSPSVMSVEITATNASVAKGTSTQLTGTAIYSNNNHADVTTDLTWTSSNAAVATVSSSGKVSTVDTGTATISVTCAVASDCGTLSASFVVTVTPAIVASIALTPPIPSVAAGTTQQFTASGTFSDNTTQNLSADLTWTSSNPKVATVSASGLATTVGAGSATITASCAVASVCSSLSGTAALTVTPATVVSIALTPPAPSIAAGTSQQFIATATFSDHTNQNLSASLTWTSSNSAVATVSGSGLVSTLAAGSATIAATCKVASVCGSLAGSTTITVTAATLVSIAITPTAPGVALGTNESFTATGTYSDHSTQNLTSQVTWMSATVGVATISNASGFAGVAQPVAVGTTQITAALGSITSPASTLTVTPATLLSIAITPTAPSVAVAATQQLVATGTYSDNSTQTLTTAVTWASSATNVASVSNAAPSQGLATGLMAGTSSISATLGAVSSTAVTLTVTAPPAEAVFYSFSGRSDGVNPYAGLLEGSDQNFYGTTSGGGANGAGTIFMITPAGIETVLYSFGSSGTDGQDPTGGLILGTDGNFYGTTYSGGANSHGTVFKITPAGVETVLWSFGSGTDGKGPIAGLIQGSDGNLYGTTYYGGANGYGTVFKITPAGVETVLYSFGGGTDGLDPYAGLIQGSDGAFYGTTYQGGANGDGTVFRITPAGAETVVYSFGGGTDGQQPVAPLMVATDGNFYGTTYLGGALGDGTVFKITPAGVETVIWSFGSGADDGQNPYAGLIQGTDGNFYGTTYLGGALGEGTIFNITPAGVETVLGSFGSGADGQQPLAPLILGSDGHFYGTTYVGGANGDGTVFKY